MAITPDVDTYGTVAEADAYFLARYGYGSWAALDTSVKEQALRSAVQQEDLLSDWYGYKSDSDQILEFPRAMVDIDADPTPDPIKHAQFEIAYAITSNESVSTVADDPLTELKAGSVTMKFKSSTPDNPIINDLVVGLIAPYGSFKSATSVPMVRN